MIVYCINIRFYKVSKYFGVINKLHIHINRFVVTEGWNTLRKNWNKNPAFDSILAKNELAMKYIIVYCIEIHFYKASKHFRVKIHKLPTHIYWFLVNKS